MKKSTHRSFRIKRAIARARQTVAGRAACRLLGDETGAVMMEYVILAVLIAAAVVVSVIFFGRTIMTQLNTAAAATLGETKKAESLHKKGVQQARSGDSKADKYNRSFHDQR